MDKRVEIDECIFDFIYGMAINDALKRVSAKGDKDIIANDDKIRMQ